MWMWILIGLNIITKANGFSHGNVPTACKTMKPMHDNRDGVFYPPQTTEPPFRVRYEHGENGEPITVFLQSTGNTKFMGFMLEAREQDNGSPVGKFILLDTNVNLLTCNGLAASAVTQINNVRKSLIRVKWSTEREDLRITFRATFVQDYDTFWEGVNITLATPSTTTSITMPSPTESSTTSTTMPSPTESSTTTSTTMPSPTESSTTTSTTMPSPTESSTTTSTTMPSSTEPSTTTSTTMPSSTEPSTTTSTTMPSSTEPSTTRSTTRPTPTTPSTTTSTTRPTPTKPNNDNNKSRRVGEAAFVKVTHNSLNIFHIFVVTVFPQCLNKVLKILCWVLFTLIEIPALVLFALGNSIHCVTLLTLVCVMIVMNLIQLVIVCLSLKQSHELYEILDITSKVCFVISEIVTSAVIFISVREIEDCRLDQTECWSLSVMIAYTVWTFLFVILFILNALINKEGSNNCKRGRQKQEKKLHTLTLIVSLILIVGRVILAVTLIVGIQLGH